ncbi:N5-glutamine methyltransferase family protein [Corynebacterium choanae]|uniref:N5-glutamine methyltransferase family protein n=1 Tax=Corynebacterium choanae TaxID=1862358 RepID=UPI0036224668
MEHKLCRTLTSGELTRLQQLADPTLTVNQARMVLTALFTDAGIASPAVDARLLLAHLLDIAPLELVFVGDQPAPAGLVEAARLRASRIPLQHIVGTADFAGLLLAVGDGAFIPRPETELVVDWVVRDCQEHHLANPIIVDLCTGPATILCALQQALPAATLIGVEQSAAALGYARQNVATYAPQATLIHGDVTRGSLLDTLADVVGRVDVVVSNPPYVPLATAVDFEVTHDPTTAVFAEDSGMSVIAGMMPQIEALLRPAGRVSIEHDDSHREAMHRLLEQRGCFEAICTHRDLADRDRFTTASKHQ